MASAVVSGTAGVTAVPPTLTDQSNFQISFATESTVNTEKNLMIVSPYEEEAHQLDLETLDVTNQLLAKALVAMKSLREDYATAPYEKTFNWSEIVNHLRQLAKTSNVEWKEAAFYIVVFRSRIPPTTVYADLGELDKAAHAEATKSGGFLKYVSVVAVIYELDLETNGEFRYWFGTPDQEGRNLATCVWRRPEDAKAGSIGPAHRKAAGATRYLYSDWKIERLRLLIRDGAQDWEIGQWVD